MIPDRYNISNLRSAASDSQVVIEEAQRLRRSTIKILGSLKFKMKHREPGENFIKKDWDNMIILDACRYDAFGDYLQRTQTEGLEGEFLSAISLGSRSMEFMRKNFYDEKYHDTVYITANPNIENFSDKIFHKIYKTYDYRGSPEPRGFFPSKVYDDVIDAFERYPNKRLLIHFMQPHAPYIGGKAKKLYNELKESHGISIERHAKMFDTDLTDNVYSTWHHVADDGYIDNSQLWELYMENLHIGMEQALKTIRKLEGKTLITSDHGELLGEDSRFGLPPGYGHPKKVYHEKLRIVPWYIIDSDVRRTTISETPKMSNDINEETVKEHLRALGYK